MVDKTEQTDLLLFSRLAIVLMGRRSQLVKNPHVIGRSTTVWEVDALVRYGSKQTVFEGVKNHPASIAFAAMKFNDIASNDNAPRCFAVVRNEPALGKFQNILSQSGANLIEDSISDEKIIELAEAA